jgi:hypothetical protein
MEVQVLNQIDSKKSRYLSQSASEQTLHAAEQQSNPAAKSF